MDDEQLLRAIEHDDTYRIVRVLADKASGRTELVKGSGPELLIRKYIPDELANKRAWYALQGIRSPLLPQVRDLYQLPNSFVAVTSYVEGATLAELIESLGTLSVRDASSYVMDLCDAALVLHEHGIVHRDITPNNVVVAQGHARLIDLGNARAYVEGAKHDTTRMGTFGFAAPEQFGFAQTDARSDVYALGSMLGYLLTGVQPSDEGFEQALADESRVPFVLRVVIDRARAFEPSARYRDVDELAVAMQAAIGRSAVVDRSSREQHAKTNQSFREHRTETNQAKRPAEQLPLPMRIVRWFFPALPTPRRTWSELRHLEKLFVVLSWTFYFVILVPLSVGFFGADKGNTWADAFSVYAIATLLSSALILFAREVHLLVTCLGPGCDKKAVLKTFALRAFVLVVFCFALSALAVYVSIAINKVLHLS